MSVSKKEVSYIANLARLNLKDEEVERLAKDMNRILEYIELLNEVDTENIAPLEHVTELTTPFREDKAEKPLNHDLALKNAPDADSDYFRVPKVIE
jgi:aspartyl-tRNA(Asn)/glutamyl-tRNA(Gln) amidotransferase subunit C